MIFFLAAGSYYDADLRIDVVRQNALSQSAKTRSMSTGSNICIAFICAMAILLHGSIVV